jgi:small subunit ribosomal protein S20
MGGRAAENDLLGKEIVIHSHTYQLEELMAQHKSAEKRMRSSKKREDRNTTRESKVKTLVKKVRTAKTKETGDVALKEAVSVLDKLALKRVIHPNKASNQKSKLTKYVNTLK